MKIQFIKWQLFPTLLEPAASMLQDEDPRSELTERKLRSDGAKSIESRASFVSGLSGGPFSSDVQSSSIIGPAPMMRASTEPTKKTRSKFHRFTRKATKLAADVAFGSAINEDGMDTQRLADYRRESRFKAEEARKEQEIKHFEIVFKAVRDHSMEFYLDYLRFFLKYMDDGDWGDVLTYAEMRNDLWRGWLRKTLAKVSHIIESWENDTSGVVIPRQVGNFSIKDVPDVSKIDKELFHDRKITLLLLWHTQVLKRLMNQPLILQKLTASMKKDCEICIVTSNKIKPKEPTPDEFLPRVLRTHISPAHVEVIDGWQMRHDVQQFKINFITLADRYQTLLDLRKAGTLPEDIHQQYPYFNDEDFLTPEFVQGCMSQEERNFLNGYSSFAVPSLSKIPLADGNHALIYSPDFSRLVKTEAEMKRAFAEFTRLLKPGGKVYLQLMDLNPIPKVSSRVGLNKETINVCPEEHVRLLINTKLAEYAGPFRSRMTFHILSYLKRSDQWSDVKFTKIGFPVIEGDRYGSGLENEAAVKRDDSEEVEATVINSRAAAMFDMNASFIEFLKFTSVLGPLEWYEGGMRPPPEVLELVKLWIDWRRFGMNGKLVTELVKSRKLVDGVDLELGVRIDCNAPNTNIQRSISGLEFGTAVIAQRI